MLKIGDLVLIGFPVMPSGVNCIGVVVEIKDRGMGRISYLTYYESTFTYVYETDVIVLNR